VSILYNYEHIIIISAAVSVTQCIPTWCEIVWRDGVSSTSFYVRLPLYVIRGRASGRLVLTWLITMIWSIKVYSNYMWTWPWRRCRWVYTNPYITVRSERNEDSIPAVRRTDGIWC